LYNVDPLWLTIAAQEIGVKEIMGIKHNPRILEYHKATVLAAESDEIPWCSAFVNWAMLNSGIKGTGSALARSWLQWGNKLDTPKRGAVVVLRRGKEKWQGHVGFYLGEDDHTVRVLGGNQKNKVGIVPYPKSKVLDYRWPHFHS
jgi:uncharacterized protein (TIGR02594 family)